MDGSCFWKDCGVPISNFLLSNLSTLFWVLKQVLGAIQSFPPPPLHALYVSMGRGSNSLGDLAVVKQTGRGARCQDASWEDSIDFWEDEGNFQEDVKFDPEPLGFPEKRREEGFIDMRTTEAKAWSDREEGEASGAVYGQNL